MSRPLKPNALKILNGSARHNPGRHKEDHLIPEDVGELGDPPTHLDEPLRTIWNEIIEQVHPDIIQKSDRLALEGFCRCVQALREDEGFSPSQHQRFMSYAAAFGMTPADRQRVRIVGKPKPKAGHRFADFV